MKLNNKTFSKFFYRITPNLFFKPLGSNIWGDVNGALTGVLASIPQTLAFGLIIGSALGGSYIGMGVLIALYGSVSLGMFATIFGGCPFLVAGPRASTVLIFSTLIAQLSHSSVLSHFSDPASIALVLACTAVIGSGILQVLFGAFQFGKLTNYVPFPVMSGFITGSALIIILSQVCPAMGISEQKSLLGFLNHINEIKPATVALSLATAASMLLLPRLTKSIPPMPFAFIAWTGIYHFLALFGLADAMGGTITPPPEHFNLHFVGGEAFAMLSSPIGIELIFPILAASLSMSILSSLDTLFATAATDELTMRRSNSGRQLMAEGFGNALAGMFGMAPGSGGLARTKAALNGGMKSAMAPIGIALITLLVAWALGSVIGLMSHAVMAGILIALGIDLIDIRTLRGLKTFLFRNTGQAVDLSDILVVTAVVTAALIFDLTASVGIGVLLSILLFVTQMARNPVRRNYRATALIPRIYGDIERQQSLECFGQSIAIIEIEGVLFFGTVSELESRVEVLVNEGIVHVVLDMRRVKHVDATGARTIERMNARLSQLGGMLVISHIDRERRKSKNHVTIENKRRQVAIRGIWVKLDDCGTISALGSERFQNDTDAAVILCEKHLSAIHAGASLPNEQTVSQSPLLRSLNRSKLRQLRKNVNRISYEPGSVVFLQGSPPDGAYFVVSGQVGVMIDLPGTDRKRKVQSLTSGSIFGEMALIDPHPRSATIIAEKPTTCYYISSEKFERLKHEQPETAFALISATTLIFAERLRATNKMLAEMEA